MSNAYSPYIENWGTSTKNYKIFWIDEKNDRLKDPIRKRFVEYLDRAEMLKEFLDDQEKKQKEPLGANGASKK